MPVERPGIERRVNALIEQAYLGGPRAQPAVNELAGILEPRTGYEHPSTYAHDQDLNAFLSATHAAMIVARTPPRMTPNGQLDLLSMAVVHPFLSAPEPGLSPAEQLRPTLTTLAFLAAEQEPAAHVIFMTRRDLFMQKQVSDENISDMLLIEKLAEHLSVAQGIVDDGTMLPLTSIALQGARSNVGEHIIESAIREISKEMSGASNVGDPPEDAYISNWKDVVNKLVAYDPSYLRFLESQLHAYASNNLEAIQMLSLRLKAISADLLRDHVDQVSPEARAIIRDVFRG